MSPSLRWWPSWWWSLHLRSFRCRLLDGSHYTRPTYVVQIEPIQTTPKPLQTLAFIGVSQPHDGDINTAGATATATTSRVRHGGCDAQDAAATATTDATQPRPRRATATPRDVTATSRRPCPGTPRHPGHDSHATARPQPRHGHDGHDGHGHDRIQRNVPARYHTTRQNTIAQTFQRCTMQQTPPWGSVPPAQKARPLAL